MILDYAAAVLVGVLMAVISSLLVTPLVIMVILALTAPLGLLFNPTLFKWYFSYRRARNISVGLNCVVFVVLTVASFANSTSLRSDTVTDTQMARMICVGGIVGMILVIAWRRNRGNNQPKYRVI